MAELRVSPGRRQLPPIPVTPKTALYPPPSSLNWAQSSRPGTVGMESRPSSRAGTVGMPLSHRQGMGPGIRAKHQHHHQQQHPMLHTAKLMHGPTPSASTAVSTNPASNSEYAEASSTIPRRVPVGCATMKGIRLKAFNTRSTHPNQDDFCAIRFGPSGLFLAVCDGHGREGHRVSHFLKNNLPGEVARGGMWQTNPEMAMRLAFQRCSSLLQESTINTEHSGSTVVAALKWGRQLAVAHVGDSRAILVSGAADGQPSVEQLTEDHTPEVKTERERIEGCSGMVLQKTDGTGKAIGPVRVWDAQRRYGLAVSRSMGDHFVRSAGVLDEPEISMRALQPNDRYLVLASDGVWSLVSNAAVAQLCAHAQQPSPALSMQQLSERIVSHAREIWRKRGPTSDDITVVVAAMTEG